LPLYGRHERDGGVRRGEGPGGGGHHDARATFARADVRKSGRRVANVHAEAWQEERGAPVAFLLGHFLLSGGDGG
jgi:hypothetical protein